VSTTKGYLGLAATASYFPRSLLGTRFSEETKEETNGYIVLCSARNSSSLRSIDDQVLVPSRTLDIRQVFLNVKIHGFAFVIRSEHRSKAKTLEEAFRARRVVCVWKSHLILRHRRNRL